jgi:hypothetical protein
VSPAAASQFSKQSLVPSTSDAHHPAAAQPEPSVQCEADPQKAVPCNGWSKQQIQAYIKLLQTEVGK